MIYYIIEENKDSFTLENGNIDKKLKKLEFTNIKKKNVNSKNKKKKLRITDKNKNIFTPSNKNIKRNTNTMESMEIEEKVLIESV